MVANTKVPADSLLTLVIIVLIMITGYFFVSALVVIRFCQGTDACYAFLPLLIPAYLIYFLPPFAYILTFIDEFILPEFLAGTSLSIFYAILFSFLFISYRNLRKN